MVSNCKTPDLLAFDLAMAGVSLVVFLSRYSTGVTANLMMNGKMINM